MSLDYKTLQTMSAGQPDDAERYCPECGRPLSDSPAERAEHSVPFSWRSAILGVIGVYMVITFGVRAWSVYPIVARDNLSRWEVEECTAQLEGQPSCRPFFPDPARELRRDLLVATGGMLAILVGLGAIVRRHLRARPDRPCHLVAVTLWGMGEDLLTGACALLLALFVDLVGVEFALGRRPTWEMLDRAIAGVLALISVVTGVS